MASTNDLQLYTKGTQSYSEVFHYKYNLLLNFSKARIGELYADYYA